MGHRRQWKKPQQEEPMSDELVVVAHNPVEMEVAQRRLIGWATQKLTETQTEMDEAQENLDNARRHKWKISGFQRLVLKARERLGYYEKMKAALEAGYVIIPNMDLQFFAFRTTKESPDGYQKGTGSWGKPRSDDPQLRQDTNRPKVGDGKYVNPEPKLERETSKKTDDAGKEVTVHEAWATEVQDIDFPFKLVKPQIMDATAAALKLKIFDQVGVAPVQRGRDPMIIGQLVCKGRSNDEQVLSFLIAWWMAESDLVV